MTFYIMLKFFADLLHEITEILREKQISLGGKTLSLLTIARAGVICLVAVWLLNSCSTSVEDYYGTYIVKDEKCPFKSFTLDSESISVEEKRGKIDVMLGGELCTKSVIWGWDLELECVFFPEGVVLDMDGKKLYLSPGEYVDRRNGYKFKKD